ncbi:hypothetical protein PV755_09195 [Streptomyces caniscabiei]|uniref:Uncharacterized protein n=1 Tax=Streptomyces caniscabiei TaxID=2746961 RepID=A0A927QE07_9ACTN|nr:hypothetical protein [Streptomyces caniscabiei]MBD9721905.1 hypothetical protein [Streptomyces caniscabiei]MDX3509096.1 hypothetical protein [Streptomyces caniscabiei]MDX3717151.1 hypothetical protein [Streptomyces caniscabiei]WEO23018.1 hypothetical protein IHE65_07530 [Streptomyces caniscabiei]
MTVSLLPVRFDLRRRTPRKHRAADEVNRLRGFLAGAHQLINGLQLQLDEADARHADTATKQAEAELLVVQQQADIDELTAERDHWRDDALALRARFSIQLAAEANAAAVTVPCGYRDTSAIEDQATGPIDVRPLWEARDAGLL